jgi:hypothetical protein
MDSATIVTILQKYMAADFANMIYAIIVIAIPVLYRALIAWANNRPTTWYWNPVTKKFAVKWLDKQVAKICGRGVNDCRIKYEKDLPDEAKLEIQKRLKKQHEFLNIEISKDGKVE